MTTYKDIFTGKTFTVRGDKVTDAFGNVATVNANEWLEMQGSDVVVVTIHDEVLRDNELFTEYNVWTDNANKSATVTVWKKDGHTNMHYNYCGGEKWFNSLEEVKEYLGKNGW